MKPSSRVMLRSAKNSEARALHALIAANLEEGHLLPRTLGELKIHAGRFVVATRGRRIVGCAELAALSAHVAEVRSLVVDPGERGHGVGTMIVDELRRRARTEGFDKLCAFTHAPAYFIPMGFSIVPHTWLLEKVTTDCVKCPLFRRCGQYAMVVPVESAYEVDRTPAHEPAVVRYA
jgi:amino-acid N-acetyltransferase